LNYYAFMNGGAMQNELLRLLPSVDEVLRFEQVQKELSSFPHNVIVGAIREALNEARSAIIAGKNLAPENITRRAYLEMIALKTITAVKRSAYPTLRRVINATGVILHTNLGRAPLGRQASQAVNDVVLHYSNLELDLATGKRGSRYMPLEKLLTSLTGAEAAMVVNNNAAAVLLVLSSLARGQEVIVSRGQLVEIGGSFRIPEVMSQSGAVLVEVGTTNKTYPEDYRRAVNENTALLLHVHTSNYRIVGFAREITVSELVELGREYKLPVVSDLGSGFFIDLSRYGLPWEPTVQETVRAGADVVTFSGDKLLGGPQAGIIVGKSSYIDRMKTNPLTRAIRVDKMTVAALEATLRLYLDEAQAMAEIPVLRMLTLNLDQLKQKAVELASLIRTVAGKRAQIDIDENVSAVGGGAMPTTNLPTYVVALQPVRISASELQELLRNENPAVIGRIQEDKLLLDVRTIGEDEFPILVDTIDKTLK
jgi:L-seryl-tRNA(Ser) seleniumtransferase